jgi:hypothetical protein
MNAKTLYRLTITLTVCSFRPALGIAHPGSHNTQTACCVVQATDPVSDSIPSGKKPPGEQTVTDQGVAVKEVPKSRKQAKPLTMQEATSPKTVPMVKPKIIKPVIRVIH